jgi:hypothetical protein
LESAAVAAIATGPATGLQGGGFLILSIGHPFPAMSALTYVGMYQLGVGALSGADIPSGVRSPTPSTAFGVFEPEWRDFSRVSIEIRSWDS